MTTEDPIVANVDPSAAKLPGGGVLSLLVKAIAAKRTPHSRGESPTPGQKQNERLGSAAEVT